MGEGGGGGGGGERGQGDPAQNKTRKAEEGRHTPAEAENCCLTIIIIITPNVMMQKKEGRSLDGRGRKGMD